MQHFLVFLTALAPFSIYAATPAFTLTVANDLSDSPRRAETLVVPWPEVSARLPGAQIDHVAVKFDGRLIPVQVTNFDPVNAEGHADALLFQHDFAAGERLARFTVETTRYPVPPFPTKVFARYVPERLDDFAWENDRVAHRVYGPALSLPSAGKNQLISSGVDLWVKRVRYPIVDRWYLKGEYHRDTGEGLDTYNVGKSRGAGGVGIWDGARLLVSGNWKTWKILANGPVRTVFEITYDYGDAGGFTAKETKRFTVDAGHNLDQVESTFEFRNPAGEITIGIGLAKMKENSTPELARDNVGRRWQSVWAEYPKNGRIGTGIVLAANAAPADFAEDDLNYLILTKAKPGQPLRYYIGAGWDRSGDFSDEKSWTAYLGDVGRRLSSPLKLEYSPAAATPKP